MFSFLNFQTEYVLEILNSNIVPVLFFVLFFVKQRLA